MRHDQIERRKHVRRAVLLHCRLEGAATQGTLQVIDLSAGGCFVRTTDVVPAGADVTVHATFAGTEVSLRGRVAHVQPGRGFAVEFVDLADETRQQLERFLPKASTPV